MLCQYVFTRVMSSRLYTSDKNTTPALAPRVAPRPPCRLAPPGMTAVMIRSSAPSPAVLTAVPTRAANARPAVAAIAPARANATSCIRAVGMPESVAAFGFAPM